MVRQKITKDRHRAQNAKLKKCFFCKIANGGFLIMKHLQIVVKSGLYLPQEQP